MDELVLRVGERGEESSTEGKDVLMPIYLNVCVRVPDSVISCVRVQYVIVCMMAWKSV